MGAALGEAGLKTQTRFGSATLMLAANLPDVDVLVFATDLPSVAFRRGWTHGVLAQALLPVALAGVVALAGRRRGARFAPLLLLAYLGVLTHVALDCLNPYGIRLLMPFSGRWFYGDSVFIIDFWLWLVLGAGVWLSWSRSAPRAALIALTLAVVYIAAMVASARVGRAVVLEQWRVERGGAPEAIMVGPMPITPFHRQIIVDAGDHYRTGTFSWFSRRAVFDPRVVPTHERDPAAERARQDPRVRAILVWARFPYYVIEPVDGGTRVLLRDLRFGEAVGAVSVVVPRRHEDH